MKEIRDLFKRVGSISKKGHLIRVSITSKTSENSSVPTALSRLALNGMSFGTQMQFDFSPAVYRPANRSVSFLKAECGSRKKV